MSHVSSSTIALPGTPIQAVNHVEYLRGDRYIRTIEGNFTDTRLKLKLGSVADNTLVLLPPDISGVAADFENSDVHLTKMPGLEVGRQNSRSEVDFGQLYIGGTPHKPTTQQVAVKYNGIIPAVREFFAGRSVDNRFGMPITFRPIGFIRDEKNNVGGLTKYDHGVVSLDNILWNKSATVEQRLNAMAFAGLALALLHTHGIIHGDAQAKNIAYGTDGLPRYIDLEGASDITYGPHDNETKRLLDIGNLFDPQTNRIYAEPEEIATFIDAYTNTQGGTRGKLDGLDILDTIDSMQEQYGR